MIYRHHLFKNSLPLINRSLDAYAMRQKTISKNIANATSENYRPERVRFEEYFQDAQVVIKGSKTSEEHIPLGKTNPAEIAPTEEIAAIPEPEIYFAGESHVNIDREMSELAQNQIRFRFSAAKAKGFFGGLNSSITGNPER